MKRRYAFFLTGLCLFSSCSAFQTGRTYLTEMEQDDSSFFNPREDFPVVAGDTGRFWNTESERRARTPTSIEEREEDLHSRSLRHELKDLEGSQSEESLNQYSSHKHQFRTISEKIYFLKLHPRERAEYLESRGFIADSGSSFSAYDRMKPVKKKDILFGMSKQDVMGSWGKPYQVEVAGNPSFENERWLYKVDGATKYIYFESGRVEGWE